MLSCVPAVLGPFLPPFLNLTEQFAPVLWSLKITPEQRLHVPACRNPWTFQHPGPRNGPGLSDSFLVDLPRVRTWSRWQNSWNSIPGGRVKKGLPRRVAVNWDIVNWDTLRPSSRNSKISQSPFIRSESTFHQATTNYKNHPVRAPRSPSWEVLVAHGYEENSL